MGLSHAFTDGAGAGIGIFSAKLLCETADVGMAETGICSVLEGCDVVVSNTVAISSTNVLSQESILGRISTFSDPSSPVDLSCREKFTQ